jgi:hypothetical protein
MDALASIFFRLQYYLKSDFFYELIRIQMNYWSGS